MHRCALVALALCLACTPKDSEVTTETEAMTEVGTTEVATTEPTGGADPDRADFDAVAACGGNVVCPEWIQYFAESTAETLAPERLCVFSGLQSGVVGRYTYVVDREFTNGHYTTTAILQVHADREVTFSMHHDGFLDEEGPFDLYDAAMTCTLAEAQFFGDCASASDGLDTTCLWLPDPWSSPLPWFTGCVAMGPMCA